MRLLLNILKPKSGWIVFAIIVGWQMIGALFFTLGAYPKIASLEAGTMPEESFGYSADEINSWLTNLADSGRELYQQFQLLDVANAAITAVALTAGLSYTLQRLFPENKQLQLITYIPSLVFILELLENLLLYINAANFPDSFVVGLASTITITKLILGFGSIIIFFVTAIWTLGKHVRIRNGS